MKYFTQIKNSNFSLYFLLFLLVAGFGGFMTHQYLKEEVHQKEREDSIHHYNTKVHQTLNSLDTTTSNLAEKSDAIFFSRELTKNMNNCIFNLLFYQDFGESYSPTIPKPSDLPKLFEETQQKCATRMTSKMAKNEGEDAGRLLNQEILRLGYQVAVLPAPHKVILLTSLRSEDLEFFWERSHIDLVESTF